MNPEDVKLLIDFLIKNGEILGTKMYELAYRQALFNAVSTFIWTFIFIGFILFTVRLFVEMGALKGFGGDKPIKNNIYTKIYNADLEDITKVVCGVLSGIFMLLIPFISDCWINFLINPQWMAIKVIFSLLGSSS
jgi:hypothetical protein